mmetsp:Transcript_22357/g.56213  ORF Transcript_22357/g.56213 Transcript_22357/m.56213 type:complete len:229 (+) Transcript_22357:1145-1831(+)
MAVGESLEGGGIHVLAGLLLHRRLSGRNASIRVLGGGGLARFALLLARTLPRHALRIGAHAGGLGAALGRACRTPRIRSPVPLLIPLAPGPLLLSHRLGTLRRHLCRHLRRHLRRHLLLLLLSHERCHGGQVEERLCDVMLVQRLLVAVLCRAPGRGRLREAVAVVPIGGPPPRRLLVKGCASPPRHDRQPGVLPCGTLHTGEVLLSRRHSRLCLQLNRRLPVFLAAR